MSLMLANRYFLDRDYARALPLLEETLGNDPGCSAARKKAIVCYVLLERIEDAVRELLEAMRRDPRSILDTDPEEEDCPCPELCRALEKKLPYAADPYPVLVSLGALEAYCSAATAAGYLRRAAAMQPDHRVREIVEILEKEEG